MWTVPDSSLLDVDEINDMLRTQFPGTGNRCIEIGSDFAVAAYDVQPSDIRPGGFVSGPCQFAIVDCALWFLAFVALGRIEPMALTSELSIRFLRPAQGEPCSLTRWCLGNLQCVNGSCQLPAEPIGCGG